MRYIAVERTCELDLVVRVDPRAVLAARDGNVRQNLLLLSCSSVGRRLDRRENLADELVERTAATEPPHDGDDVVLPVDIDNVAAVALEVDGRRGRRRYRLPVRVQEPVRVPIVLVRRSRRARHLDPFLRHQLAILPLAVVE